MCMPGHQSLVLSFLPPSEKPFEKAGHEHQCAVWLGDTMAKSPAQVPTSGGQRHFVIHPFSKSLGTLETHPLFGHEYRVQV